MLIKPKASLSDWRMVLVAVVTAWFAIGISATALVVSILSYRRGVPVVKVTGTTSLMAFDDGIRPYILISATNPSGVPVQIRRVSLDAVGGGYVRHVTPGEMGPALPAELAANGGHATWGFDYTELRQSAYYQTVRDETLTVRATVQVGNRVFRQRGFIAIPEPGSTGTVSVPKRERIRSRWRLWTHPSVVFFPFTSVNDLDMEHKTTTLTFLNGGKWFTRPVKLTLVVERPDGQRERVPGVEPAYIPRIAPRRQVSVRIPLVVDSPTETNESYWWVQTGGPGVGSGYGAPTLSEAQKLNSDQKAANRLTAGEEGD